MDVRKYVDVRRLGTYYALTISPPDRTVGKARVPLANVYLDDIINIRRWLGACSKHYCMYPEFSTTGRLHYHGVVQFHDKIKWFRQTKGLFEKRMGYVQLDPLKTPWDYLSWVTYCKKEFNSAQQILQVVDPIYPSKMKVWVTEGIDYTSPNPQVFQSFHYYPESHDPAVTERFKRACARDNRSRSQSGSESGRAPTGTASPEGGGGTHGIGEDYCSCGENC